MRAAIRRQLLAWFDSHQRSLPWRETHDPYPIWVSEIMLQQTRVATVIDYYRRWMLRYPTVHALAEADQADVLKSWEGLGYYSRARNLQAAAQVVVREHGGKLPSSAEQLKQLPGIGSYTAGAVASIAFNQPEPAIDGNVNRVICRLFGLPGDPLRTATRNAIIRSVRSLLTKSNARLFNQALMELGASHCSPTNASCWQCPIGKQCRAYREDRVDLLPEKAARKPLVKEHHCLAIVQRKGKVLTLQTPDDAARWANLWVFPSLKVPANSNARSLLQNWLDNSLGLATSPDQQLASIRYHVTRFDIELDVHKLKGLDGRVRTAMGFRPCWRNAASLRDIPMPAPHRKIEKSLRHS